VKLARARAWLAAAATALCLTSCSVSGLTAVAPSSATASAAGGHCAFRDHGQLPDPRCTPGAVDPNVTQANLRPQLTPSRLPRDQG